MFYVRISLFLVFILLAWLVGYASAEGVPRISSDAKEQLIEQFKKGGMQNAEIRKRNKESAGKIQKSNPPSRELTQKAEETHEQFLRISRHPAKVVPRRVLPITPDMAGEVEVIHRAEGRVKKDTLLLRINPEELALDEQELHQQMERNNLAAETEILQLVRQKEELEFISKLPPERRMYVVQHLKADVDKRALDLLERKIAVTRENARLSNERLQKAFEKKRKLREITMPFDGRIQYHFAMPEEGQTALVGTNNPAVTIADDSVLYVVVNMTDPALSRLEASRLSVLLEMGGGRTLIAPWSHSKVQKGDRGETMVYYFTVPDKMRGRVWSQVGANLVAHLRYRAETDDVYVSKSELAQEAGERRFESWEELLAALRPGYAMVFNGETHLCLKRTKSEEQSTN